MADSNSSPSAEIIKAAKAETAITDSTGRVIMLRKPGVLAQYRLIEAIGASSSNDRYVSMCLPLIYVGSINGDPVMGLSRKSEVEALIQQLGDEGIAAVMKGVRDTYGEQDPEADKAEVKN
jgi:hypothetical protein